MIQEFSVQNFLSFREKQTISFLATADKTLINELTVEPKPGVRLLRMALIYGANASGKSNLILSIQALWNLLFTPQQNEHTPIRDYQPFSLCKGEPTRIEATFWANGRRYCYELEYNEDQILYENMQYTTDSDKLSLMYERRKGEAIKFGGTLDIKAKERNKLMDYTLGNHTILSSFNKINIDIPVMKELYEWIKGKVHELGIYNDGQEIATQAEKNPELKRLMLELLNKADFNISDFQLIEMTLSKEIADEIKKDEDLSISAKERLLKPNKQLIFTHQTPTDTFPISFGMESSGTRVYFRLARMLFDLKESGSICLEDEIEDSLHYDLLIHFLKTYLQTPCSSQFIFTTHNQMLLDEDWMIRRDMVWFTEKDRESCSTILYSAAEMGIHKNVSLLNAYKIGKLGAKPNLGSTLLNSDAI